MHVLHVDENHPLLLDNLAQVVCFYKKESLLHSIFLDNLQIIEIR